MRKKILSLSFLIFLIGFILCNGSLFESTTLAQSNIILIKEGLGVGNIEVGKSTADDVITNYGKKYKLIKHADYSYEMYFKKQCLSFYYKHNDDTKNIFTVSVKSPCKAVTTKGITLGESTLKDVANIYGEVEPLTTTANETWFYEYSGIQFNVVFNSWEEADTEDFLKKKIVEIDITRPEDFTPPKKPEKDKDEETDSSTENDG